MNASPRARRSVRSGGAGLASGFLEQRPGPGRIHADAGPGQDPEGGVVHPGDAVTVERCDPREDPAHSVTSTGGSGTSIRTILAGPSSPEVVLPR